MCCTVGKSKERSSVEHGTSNRMGTLRCFYCNSVPIVLGCCPAQAYYIMPLDRRYTRLMIHQGNHNHEVQVGSSKATLENVRKLVKNAVENVDGRAGPRRIQMEVVKEISMAALMEVEVDIDACIGGLAFNNLLQQLYPLVHTTRYMFHNKQLRKWEIALIKKCSLFHSQVEELGSKILWWVWWVRRQGISNHWSQTT